MIQTISGLRPGTTISMVVIRGGEEESLRIRLGTRDTTGEGNDDLWPGITVAPITPDLRRRLDLGRNDGELVIGYVDKNSGAARAGLRSGDVIKKINGSTLRSIGDFYEILDDGKRFSLELLRQGDEFELTLKK